MTPDPESYWAELQAMIHHEVGRRWPEEDILRRGLALGEEAGEVQRAILKRTEGHRTTDLDGLPWSENLRLELGQVILVALSIAEAEGFSAFHALHDAFLGLLGKTLADGTEPDPREAELAQALLDRKSVV